MQDGHFAAKKVPPTGSSLLGTCKNGKQTQKKKKRMLEKYLFFFFTLKKKKDIKVYIYRYPSHSPL